MKYYNTILSQITTLIPRYIFDYHSDIHHSEQKFQSYDRWSQLMAMLMGQLSSRKSLRDIVVNLKARQLRLYRLGLKTASRPILARLNEK